MSAANQLKNPLNLPALSKMPTQNTTTSSPSRVISPSNNAPPSSSKKLTKSTRQKKLPPSPSGKNSLASSKNRGSALDPAKGQRPSALPYLIFCTLAKNKENRRPLPLSSNYELIMTFSQLSKSTNSHDFELIQSQCDSI